MQQSAVVALQMFVDQADEDLRDMERRSPERMSIFNRMTANAAEDAAIRKSRERETWRMFKPVGGEMA